MNDIATMWWRCDHDGVTISPRLSDDVTTMEWRYHLDYVQINPVETQTVSLSAILFLTRGDDVYAGSSGQWATARGIQGNSLQLTGLHHTGL